MEQRIFLDKDNKLVIESNNGIQRDNDTTIKIKGNFIVKDSDVVKLFSIINKKDCIFPRVIESSSLNISYNHLLSELYVFDNNIADLITEYKSIIEKIGAENKCHIIEINERHNLELKEYKEKIHKLKSAIERFNNSRKWYERKLNID